MIIFQEDFTKKNKYENNFCNNGLICQNKACKLVHPKMNFSCKSFCKDGVFCKENNCCLNHYIKYEMVSHPY